MEAAPSCGYVGGDTVDDSPPFAQSPERRPPAADGSQSLRGQTDCDVRRFYEQRNNKHKFGVCFGSSRVPGEDFLPASNFSTRLKAVWKLKVKLWSEAEC